MNAVRPVGGQTVPRCTAMFSIRAAWSNCADVSFGSQKSIDVEIYGYDFEKARTVISRPRRSCTRFPGMADIEVSRRRELP